YAGGRDDQLEEELQMSAHGAYADVNGLRMYYEIHGEGEPLLLLHGGMLTIDTTFGALIPPLAKEHLVVAVEMQGHGHTADIDRVPTLDALASDVVGLLDELGTERADMLGFSLGGLVGLEIAVHHPQVLGRLVAAAAHVRPNGYHAEIFDEELFATSDKVPTPADFQAMVDSYRAVAPDPDHFHDFMAKQSAVARTITGWTDEQLAGIRSPTLVMIGDRDFVRIEHGAEMLELIPGSQLAVLPGATHMALMRRTEQVLAMVVPFLTAA
ncbi:MAG: mhpC, partial [Ilumatobacteraceae bacterium]|nr:mhpC [Ilumatobacteraceae bacterium]